MLTREKKRILVFCEFYRPGFKSGGGMWTIANLIDRLSDEYDFGVICRNHDGVVDRSPYDEVKTDDWNDLGGHWSFYVDPSKFSKRQSADLVANFGPDAIFVNSVFGLTTRMLLEARRKGLIGEIPIIVAPCGELSEYCLAIKSLKKAAFLKYAKLFGLYQGVLWKASSQFEAAEIKRQFGDDVEVMIAPDLVPQSLLPDFDLSQKPHKEPGSIQLVSVARIAPKKNLAYLLEQLSACTLGNFELSLIGGVDDRDYWKECKRLIHALPPNVRVDVVGSVRYDEVLSHLVGSHFFVLPTLNENFGYVFVEAMAAGCPLLISENTIWNEVDDVGCGRVVSLERKADWRDALEDLAAMNSAEFEVMSAKAREFALNWLASSGDVEANRRALDTAVASRSYKQENGGRE